MLIKKIVLACGLILCTSSMVFAEKVNNSNYYDEKGYTVVSKGAVVVRRGVVRRPVVRAPVVVAPKTVVVTPKTVVTEPVVVAPKAVVVKPVAPRVRVVEPRVRVRRW